MRAFLNDGAGLGTDHSCITNEYKSIEAMYRYRIQYFLKKTGYCKAEIFYDWDNRYRTPDKIKEYRLRPPKCDQCDSFTINGVYCHEKGCYNENKHYNFMDEYWEEDDIEEEFED
jgi:hypothetical protein